MIDGLLLGVFGNAIFELIRSTLSSKLTSADDDIINRIYNSLEKATDNYFEKYGDEYGDIDSCFLARQKNIDIIVRHMFYDDNNYLVTELCADGFDGVKPASKEAVSYFVNNLNAIMMEDFRLNQIIIEKKHIDEGSQIKEMLEKLLHSKEENSTGKKGWVITDEKGNTSDIVEGKQYRYKFPGGIEYGIMFKEGTRFIEMKDVNGQISYYELDEKFNVKDAKFPHELSEYTLKYPADQIINKAVNLLPNGFRKETIKLKWDRVAIAVYDNLGKLSYINVRGGWEVDNVDKVIQPRS